MFIYLVHRSRKIHNPTTYQLPFPPSPVTLSTTAIMPGTIHPYFWIRRNADTYVPLIAIDELPDSISLEGISITKKWEDVCQGEMRFLGDHFDHNGQHYVVEFLKPASDAAPSPPKVFRAPDVKDIGLSDVRGKGVIGRQDADQIQVGLPST